jgi:glycosyltransferase involved in cell wall biosynthesis
VRFARDRWLYGYGLRRANAILVQSAAQAETLKRSYGLAGRVAGMLVEEPSSTVARDIDVLWVANIRRLKRPDRILELAGSLPEVRIHMAGGPLRGEETLFRDVRHAAAARTNVTFHGRLSYWDANDLYGRAKVLVNTSDVEGFPNSYLQAWVRGIPVVTLIDPDGMIEEEGLGVAVRSPAQMHGAIRSLLGDPAPWQAVSDRCRAFMARQYGEDKVLTTYLETFDEVMRINKASAKMIVSSEARHVSDGHLHHR